MVCIGIRNSGWFASYLGDVPMMTFLAGTFLQASLARLRAEVDRNVAVELLTLINYYCHSSHLSWVWLGLAFRFLFSFSFYSESLITSALFRKFKAVRFASCGFLGTDRLRAPPNPHAPQ